MNQSLSSMYSAYIRPPSGFDALQTLDAYPLKNRVDIIAFIARVPEPTKTRGSDWMLSIALMDPSLGPARFIDLRFFRARDNLPKFQEKSEFIILRNAQIFRQQRKCGLLCQSFTQLEQVSVNKFSRQNRTRFLRKWQPAGMSSSVGQEVATYMSEFYDWLQNCGLTGDQFTDETLNTIIEPKEPTRLDLTKIKDLEPENSYSLVCIVTKKIVVQESRVILFVTDYTTNSLLYNFAKPPVKGQSGNTNYLDGSGTGVQRVKKGGFIYYDSAKHGEWDGPFGKKTLQVYINGKQANYTKKCISSGNVVIFGNIHTKLFHDILEADISDDVISEKKSFIKKLTREEKLYTTDYDDLTKREHAYKETSFKNSLLAENIRRDNGEKIECITGPKRGERIPGNTQVPLSDNSIFTASHEERKCLTIRDLVKHQFHWYVTPDKRIHYAPFVNLKCRSFIQIIDFHPPKISQFSRNLINDKSGYIPAGAVNRHDDLSKNDRKWEWAFRLLVSDPMTKKKCGGEVCSCVNLSECCEIIIDDETGRKIIGFEACEVKDGSGCYERLKNRLFLLWGNLEEIKRSGTWLTHNKPKHHGIFHESPGQSGNRREKEHSTSAASDVIIPQRYCCCALQNVPFHCCIQEYGIRLDGKWIRCFKFFDIQERVLDEV